jgi:adenylate kinase
MTKYSRLIFFGPPGAGKGTQAKELSKDCQIPHIATGDILRQAIAEQTDVGEKAQNYVDNGDLVPDEVLAELVRDRLQQPDAQPGWILDGFPRTINQAEFLDQLLDELNTSYDLVIYLDVPDEVLMERLLGRGRKDDTEETIRHRLDIFHNQTEALINFYQQRNHFLQVNGNQPLPKVTERIKTAMKEGY